MFSKPFALKTFLYAPLVLLYLFGHDYEPYSLISCFMRCACSSVFVRYMMEALVPTRSVLVTSECAAAVRQPVSIGT